MPTRNAHANWKGTLEKGSGTLEVESGLFNNASYSAGTRFGDKKGTNPEELIGAAHAGCFSMALSLVLGKHGYEPRDIITKAEVTIEQEPLAITNSALHVNAKVPGIDLDTFNKIVKQAKEACPVSNALSGINITLDAQLIPE